MKTAVALLVFASLAIVAIEGQHGMGGQRCLCRGNGRKFVNPKQIQKVEIHPASPSCGRLEVVVVMKNDGRLVCLNLESGFTKNLINIVTKKKSGQ